MESKSVGDAIDSLADLEGLSLGLLEPLSTIHRIWKAFGLQPYRTDTFKLEKVRDIVGRYLNPPERAVVLCVDEKSQIQALDRTHGLL